VGPLLLVCSFLRRSLLALSRRRRRRLLRRGLVRLRLLVLALIVLVLLALLLVLFRYYPFLLAPMIIMNPITMLSIPAHSSTNPMYMKKLCNSSPRLSPAIHPALRLATPVTMIIIAVDMSILVTIPSPNVGSSLPVNPSPSICIIV